MTKVDESNGYLNIVKVSREKWTGEVEFLEFDKGVNLILGSPNTGKTTWLQFINYILGSDKAFEKYFSVEVSEKYCAAWLDLIVSGDRWCVKRDWRKERTSIFVNGRKFNCLDFQKELMTQLNIPIVKFPRALKSSNSDWPFISFRMLYRHVYRQQRMWSDIADKQPSPEKLACLLQYFGLALEVYGYSFNKYFSLSKRNETLEKEILIKLTHLKDMLRRFFDVEFTGSASMEHFFESTYSSLSSKLKSNKLERDKYESERASIFSALTSKSGDESTEQLKLINALNENIRRLDFERGTIYKEKQIVDNYLKEDKTILSLQEELVSVRSEIRKYIHEVSLPRDKLNSSTVQKYFINYLNGYLEELNLIRPNSWRHHKVSMVLQRNSVEFLIGDKTWYRALGGTDSLYFIMAYHYAVLLISNVINSNSIGLQIIDLPADFLGEEILDKENFVIQPFINACIEEDSHFQVIVTGASFKGINSCKIIELDSSYLA